MDATIRTLPAFELAGYCLTTTMADAMKLIPPFWDSLQASGKVDELLAVLDPAADPPGLLGASVCPGGDALDYWAGVSVTGSAPSSLDTVALPAATWAIFDASGELPAAIQDLMPRIWGEWLPSAPYEAADAPLLEVYFEGQHQEVWLPVVATS